MSPGTRKGNGANGNGTNGSGSRGPGAGGFDDFDDFIRDREDPFAEPENEPRAAHDPYEDFAGARARARQPGFDRGLVDAITRILEGLGGVAGDALSPDAKRRLEKALRDLLVVLRDVINAMIERIDNRPADDFEIEEIPID